MRVPHPGCRPVWDQTWEAVAMSEDALRGWEVDQVLPDGTKVWRPSDPTDFRRQIQVGPTDPAPSLDGYHATRTWWGDDESTFYQYAPDKEPEKAEIKLNAFKTPDGGNTAGVIVPKTSPLATPPNNNPETEEEKGWWKSWGSDVTHGILGVASFVPALSVVTGAIDAGIYAAEGDYINAGLSAASMIPGGKVVTTAGKVISKGVKAIKGAEEVAEAARLAKLAEEAAKLKKAEEAVAKAAKDAEKKATQEAEQAVKKREGGNVKGREKLKCGEFGKYGNLKNKTGEGKFDRDHIPSKAALKARAAKLKGDDLTKAEEVAIDKAGEAIAIPRQAHVDVSPTYGQTKGAAAQDAEDLAGAARRDVEEMLKKIDEYDADGGCKKAYKKAVGRILRKSNADFDEMLKEVLKKVKG